MSATTSAPRSLKRTHEETGGVGRAEELALRYTQFPSFTAMGSSDVLLQLEDGGELPAHAEMLRVYSTVLRDVSRSTLPHFNKDTTSNDVAADAVIPLGAGNMLLWGQTLAALYSFKNGATDEDTWDAIMSKGLGMLERQVVRVEGGTLDDLIQLINSTSSPTTFDLCGREYRSTYEGMLITASNVTIKNGTLILHEAFASLQVSGIGVEMEKINVCKGHIGLEVMPGGSVEVRDCKFQNMILGLCVDMHDENGNPGLPPSLVARGVKICGCKRHGIWVGDSAQVSLTDCLVSSNVFHPAISVDGYLLAVRLRCVDNDEVGLHMDKSGDAVLTGCTLTGNKGGSVKAAPGSKLLLADCVMDGMAAGSCDNGVTTSNVRQVFSQEQSLACVGLYLIADKYDMPCLSKFARRSLQQSLNLSSTKSWIGGSWKGLDPWQMAAHASQCNDPDFLNFCMDLIVAPMKQGKPVLVPTTPNKTPGLMEILLEKVNSIICAKH